MPFASIPLTRADLLRNQDTLRTTIAQLVPCESARLIFPADAPREPRPLPDEQRLLLPLVFHGEPLGLLVLQGVATHVLKIPPEALAGLAGLVLHNLWLEKAAQRDPATGLLTSSALLTAATKCAERLEACMTPGAPQCLDPADASDSGRFALTVLDLDRFRRLGRRFGFRFAEDILAKVARVLAQHSPDPVLACRLSEDAFAVLTPDASRRRALDAAEDLRAAVAGLELDDPLSGRRLRLHCSLGLAVYPYDLQGAQLALDAAERARLLLEKARLAADLAKQSPNGGVLPFARALQSGGLVLEALPMERVVLNLGRLTDAREGMRFSILGRPEHLDNALPKAEVILTEVHEDVSVAEVIHMADPGWPLAPGDRAALLEEHAAPATPDHPVPADNRAELLPYQEFQAAWPGAAKNAHACVLGIARLAGEPFGLDNGSRAAHAVRQVAGLARDILGRDLLMGCYGNAGFSFLAVDTPEADIREAAKELAAQAAARLELNLSAGLASHPFLNFARADLPENARKALEHALLLESPRVALFDSISLTIAADRHFGQGDVYAAVEEYKLALLADAANLLAANSLGICYSRLGKHTQALRLFEQVLDREPGNLMARYNHGTICLKLEDADGAREDFTACLAQDPEHVFSLVRLAQLDEQTGDSQAARERYVAATKLPGGEEAALRHLARLDTAAGELDQAREGLHRLLSLNPGDAVALAMLAKLYLDSGQDPEMAATLARQSTALAPDSASSWTLLARALEACGKPAEARRAAAMGGGE